MNGLSNYHYRLWLFRLGGSLLIMLTAAIQLALASIHFRGALEKGGELRLSALCITTLRDTSVAPFPKERLLPACAFEIPGTLPLLWSLGVKKRLKHVSKEDLRFIPTIGPRTLSRIMGVLDSETWSEFKARARLSARQLRTLRGYLTI